VPVPIPVPEEFQENANIALASSFQTTVTQVSRKLMTGCYSPSQIESCTAFRAPTGAISPDRPLKLDRCAITQAGMTGAPSRCISIQNGITIFTNSGIWTKGRERRHVIALTCDSDTSLSLFPSPHPQMAQIVNPAHCTCPRYPLSQGRTAPAFV
jgi:hypothetical protein